MCTLAYRETIGAQAPVLSAVVVALHDVSEGVGGLCKHLVQQLVEEAQDGLVVLLPQRSTSSPHKDACVEKQHLSLKCKRW